MTFPWTRAPPQGVGPAPSVNFRLQADHRPQRRQRPVARAEYVSADLFGAVSGSSSEGYLAAGGTGAGRPPPPARPPDVQAVSAAEERVELYARRSAAQEEQRFLDALRERAAGERGEQEADRASPAAGPAAAASASAAAAAPAAVASAASSPPQPVAPRGSRLAPPPGAPAPVELTPEQLGEALSAAGRGRARPQRRPLPAPGPAAQASAAASAAQSSEAQKAVLSRIQAAKRYKLGRTGGQGQQAGELPGSPAQRPVPQPPTPAAAAAAAAAAAPTSRGIAAPQGAKRPVASPPLPRPGPLTAEPGALPPSEQAALAGFRSGEGQPAAPQSEAPGGWNSGSAGPQPGSAGGVEGAPGAASAAAAASVQPAAAKPSNPRAEQGDYFAGVVAKGQSSEDAAAAAALSPEQFTLEKERQRKAQPVEIITVDADYEAKAQDKDGTLYKPKVATWGVFPRPANISRQYGGGRTITPGEGEHSPEAAQKRREELRAKVAAYRRQMGLDTDPAVEAAAQAAFAEGRAHMRRGELAAAAARFEAAGRAVALRTATGGEAALQLAICLDSLGRRDDAMALYERLKGHSAGTVSKTARQMLFGFAAADNLKAHTMKFGASSQDYLPFFTRIQGSYNTAYSGSAPSGDEGDDRTALVANVVAFTVMAAPLVFLGAKLLPNVLK